MKRRYYVLAILLWLSMLLIYPPAGSDYDIYTYNAGLTLSGIPAFGRTGGVGIEAGHYMDYTGLQHAIHVFLTVLPFGWQAYTLAALLVLLWVLSRFNPRAAMIAAFLPPLFYVVIVYSWEGDKLIFIILPLIVLILLRSEHGIAGRLRYTAR